MKRFTLLLICMAWLIPFKGHSSIWTWERDGLYYHLLGWDGPTALLCVVNPDIEEVGYYAPGTFSIGREYFRIPTQLPPRYKGEITIPDHLELDGVECKVVEIAPYCFFQQPVTKVHLSTTIDAIGESAFKGCTGLTEFPMPDGLQTIGPSAFFGCTSLRTVGLPTDIQEISQSAFENCSSLENLAIPKNIIYVRPKTFAGCTNALIQLHDRINAIGDSAFAGNAKFVELDLSTLTSLTSCKGFEGCPNLRKVTFPSSLIILKGFRDCKALEEVVLPRHSYVIQDSAFFNCISLHDVGEEIQGCYRFYSHCFENTGLKKLVISSNVHITSTKVEEYAFGNCEHLGEVFLMMGDIELGANVFCGSDNIREVTLGRYYAPHPRGDATSFSDNVYDNAILIVPDYGISQCKKDMPWQYFKHIQGTSGLAQVPQTVNRNSVNSKCFDLSGRRLAAPPARGLYIEDGKVKGK